MRAIEIHSANIGDAERIASWLGMADINRYLAESLRGKNMTAPLIKVALRRPDQAWFLFSTAAEPLEPIGLIALDQIEPEDGVANIWYLLGAPSATGQGLTSAALQTFCALNPASLRVVTAWVASENPASIRCLEKAGFQPLGVIPDAFAIAADGASRGVSGGRCARHTFYRSLSAPGAG